MFYCGLQQTLPPLTSAARAIQEAEESGKSLLEVRKFLVFYVISGFD
jgi:hypothetical protein